MTNKDRARPILEVLEGPFFPGRVFHVEDPFR